MKVVALLASPRRKGNSNGLAESLTSIFVDEGHEVVSYILNDLNYKGCQACNGCKTRSDFCVLFDDLSPVLKAVTNADVVVLASPVYWGEVNAQMKGFIDRTYSFLTPEFVTGPVKHRLPKGKKLVFILTQGGDDALYDDIFPKYDSFFKQLELFEETYLIRGCDLSDRDDYQEREDLLDLVEGTADALLQ